MLKVLQSNAERVRLTRCDCASRQSLTQIAWLIA